MIAAVSPATDEAHELIREFDIEIAAQYPGLPINGIDVLYVDSASRRNGIASHLVHLAERLASKYEGTLYVYTASPRFYERLHWLQLNGPDKEGCFVLRQDLTFDTK